MLTATGPWEPAVVELPNGIEVDQVSNGETSLLYHEIFKESCYSKVAKHIKAGSTVVDAGANIGMFSLWAARLAGNEGRVIAFEPIPSTFRRLASNIQRNYPATKEIDAATASFRADSSGKSKCPAGGLVINEGLGDEAASPTFLSHPRMSVWSTSSEDLLESRPNATLDGFVKGVLKGAHPCVRPLLWPLVWALLWPFMQIATQTEPVQCTIRTLSEHVDRLGLDSIDLLKVDVEGAEMAVLRGVRPEHWGRVRAVVVETEPGNREAVVELLEKRGYEVRFEEPYSQEEEGGKGAGADKKGKKSALAMVYAERPGAGTREEDEGSEEEQEEEEEEAGRRQGSATKGRAGSRGKTRPKQD